MERSESITKIAAAIGDFQKKVGKIKKASNNPFFKSKYASLADILDVIQEPLAESGLSILQMPVEEYKLQTILLHTSGEYISSTYTMIPVKNDPQSIGSCITYQRRYAIGAILCLNIDEDDDGNKATFGDKKPNTIPNEPVVPYPAPNPKKLFDKKLLDSSDFFARIYEQQKKTSRFSLKNFIDKYYRIDDNCFSELVERYTEYKINNNLK